MSLLIKIFRKEDDRAVWALLFCIIFLSIFFSFCFHRAVWALESCHLLPIIFTEDTLIELADPAAEIYIAAASEVSEIVVEADTLVANCIWSDKHLNLKSDSHRILQMSPSGGSADLIFSSQYLDDGYVTSWIAVHNVSTEFIFGVPDMQRYSVFVDDEEITGSPFSPSNGQVSFSRTGSGQAETYVVTKIESDMLVITKEAEVQASYRATLNGSVELTEGSVYSAQGFEWGTQSGGPYDYSWRKTGIFSAGDFSYSAENLDAETLYYYRARALEGSSWIYGAEKSFTTMSPGYKSYGQAEIIIRHGSKERGIKITPEGGIGGR